MEQHCVAGSAGEQALPAAEVDHGSGLIEDDTSYPSDQGGTDDIVGMEHGSMRGLATRCSRVGRHHHIGLAEQLGEMVGEGALVDNDVDGRLAVAVVEGCAGGGTEDRQQRVESALRIAASEVCSVRASPVNSDGSVPVVQELSFAELVEDLDEFGSVERVAARGAKFETVVVDMRAGVAYLMVEFAVFVRAIGVSEQLPSPGAQPEIPERQPGCLTDKQRDHVCEPVTTARIAPHPCKHTGLVVTDLAVMECVADNGEIMNEPAQVPDPGCFSIGTVRQGLYPPTHRDMPIGAMNAAAFGKIHDRCKLGVQRAALPVEFLQPGRETVFVEQLELFDNPSEHAFSLVVDRQKVHQK